MVARKIITQESFDEAVKENMDTFDMTREEAIESAVQELEMQGVDLSGILKQGSARDIDKHPTVLALAKLTAALQESQDGKSLLQALQAFQRSLLCTEGCSIAEATAVAVKKSAVKQLLACCRAAAGRDAQQCELAVSATSVLTLVLGVDAARDEFAEQSGAHVLRLLLEKAEGCAAGSIAACVETASAKNETSKCAFVDEGVHVLLIDAMHQPGTSVDDLRPICAALRSFATADDLRPTTSRAFQNGRAIAKAGAPEAMLAAVRDGMTRAERAPQLVTAVCGALRRIAVNDDICTEYADAGGVAVTMLAARRYMQDAQAVRACLGLLRQLANSDAIKASIVEASGLELINQAVSCHCTSAGPLEQALGLLATLLLRNPAAAELAAESGCIDSCTEAMQACEAGFKDSAVGSQWVLRQACMALRNMVARSPQLRPALLEKGCERHLRAAKAAHPATCADVGAAALRDLGFDNYNT